MQRFETQSDLEQGVAHGRTAVVFHATWCPYCRRFQPVFEQQTEASATWDAAEVVLDEDDDPLWDTFAIDAIPVVILFEDGKPVKRLDSRRGVSITPQELAGALA